MLIRFFGPFERLAEKEVRIKLKEPISSREMLRILGSRYPAFARYSAEENDAALSAHIMLIRNGVPLKLTDSLEDTDCISILVPVTGG